MLSLLIRRAFLALLMVALVGLPPSAAPSMAAVGGMATVAMDGAPCDQVSSSPLSKSVTHDKDWAGTCANGAGCLLTYFSLPRTLSLPERLASGDAVQWRVSELGAGMAVAPDIRPPISLI
jgi:hypothetical protein